MTRWLVDIKIKQKSPQRVGLVEEETTAQTIKNTNLFHGKHGRPAATLERFWPSGTNSINGLNTGLSVDKYYLTN